VGIKTSITYSISGPLPGWIKAEAHGSNGAVRFSVEFCFAKRRSAVSAGEASRQPFRGTETRLYSTNGGSLLHHNAGVHCSIMQECAALCCGYAPHYAAAIVSHRFAFVPAEIRRTDDF